MSMWQIVAPLRGATGGMSMIRGPTTYSTATICRTPFGGLWVVASPP